MTPAAPDPPEPEGDAPRAKPAALVAEIARRLGDGDIDGALGFPLGTIRHDIEGWASRIHPDDRVRLTEAEIERARMSGLSFVGNFKNCLTIRERTRMLCVTTCAGAKVTTLIISLVPGAESGNC